MIGGKWLREIKYCGRLVKELVFLRRCAVCGQNIDAGLVCASCRRHYSLGYSRRCQPREEYLAGQSEALPEDVLSGVLLLYKYDGAYKAALHKIKFAADDSLLPLLREEAAAALPSARRRLLARYDLAVCVPTSPERRAQRGFDVPQELFAPYLSADYKNLHRGDVLTRARRTAPLFELSPLARKEELLGCFAVGEQADVSGKRILLCDDIYTTGSTMAEAAQTLLGAGAREVHGLAFAASSANWERKE